MNGKIGFDLNHSSKNTYDWPQTHNKHEAARDSVSDAFWRPRRPRRTKHTTGARFGEICVTYYRKGGVKISSRMRSVAHKIYLLLCPRDDGRQLTRTHTLIWICNFFGFVIFSKRGPGWGQLVNAFTFLTTRQFSKEEKTYLHCHIPSPQIPMVWDEHC